MNGRGGTGPSGEGFSGAVAVTLCSSSGSFSAAKARK
jgi:hypothetical protein